MHPLLDNARVAHRRGQLDAAHQAYQAIARDPQAAVALRADAYYGLGLIALQRRQPDTALHHFDLLLQAFPAHAPAHLNVGHAYRLVQNKGAAQAAYETVVSLCDPQAVAPAPAAALALPAATASGAPPSSAARAPELVAAAWNALGAMASADERHDAALACFDAALRHTPGAAFLHDQRGLALAALARYGEAEAAHRAAMLGASVHPGTLNNLAIVVKAQGRLDEAIDLLRTALRGAPDFVPALLNLGQTVALLGDYDQATAPLLRAAQLAPEWDIVHCELAQAYLALGDAHRALEHARRAVDLRPDAPVGWQNLGAARFEDGDSAGAALAFDRVIALTPLAARALTGAEARSAMAALSASASAPPPSAPTLAPIYALARFSRGCLALSGGGSLAGWRGYEARLALGAPRPAPCDAAGVPLPRWLGEPAGHHRAASEKKAGAGEPITRANHAANTGRNVSTHRAAHLPLHPAIHSPNQPQPSGHDAHAVAHAVVQAARYLSLPGKTLLIQAEQGYGDTMQFLRFVGGVMARGANVVLQVPQALLELIARSVAQRAGVQAPRIAIVAQDTPLPDGIDAYCAIASLPVCLRLGKLPRPGDAGVWSPPYLYAGAALAAAPSADMATATVSSFSSASAPAAPVSVRASASTPATMRIGFAWSGRRPGRFASTDAGESLDHQPPQYDKRAIALDELAPLFAVPGTEWYPLQTDIREDEQWMLQTFADQGSVILPEKRADDFAATASRIAHLDHVVTIDTSIAHLAGAMGKPTTLLLPWVADWRWTGTGDGSSLWYPSIHLIRQSRLRDWSNVLEAAAERIRQVMPVCSARERSGRGTA